MFRVFGRSTMFRKAKSISLVLICLALTFGLSGCTDSEVKEVMSAIDAIGEVSIEKRDEVIAANEAYLGLSAEQQKEVGNYDELERALMEMREANAQQRLYENVLNTMASLRHANGNPESLVLLDAVTNVARDRTMVRVQWEKPDGEIGEDYFWKDLDGEKISNRFGESNFTGDRGEGREPEKREPLDLGEIEKAGEFDGYTAYIYEVELR